MWGRWFSSSPLEVNSHRDMARCDKAQRVDASWIGYRPMSRLESGRLGPCWVTSFWYILACGLSVYTTEVIVAAGGFDPGCGPDNCDELPIPLSKKKNLFNICLITFLLLFHYLFIDIFISLFVYWYIYILFCLLHTYTRTLFMISQY